MKKILLTLLICLFMIPIVNADETLTTIELMNVDFTPYNNVSTYEGCVKCGAYLGDKYIYNNFQKFYSDSNNKYIFDTLWNDFYSNQGTNADFISVLILSNSSTELDLFAVLINGYKETSPYGYFSSLYLDDTFYPSYSNFGQTNSFSYEINGGYFSPFSVIPHWTNANPFVVGTGDFSSTWFYLPTTSFTNKLKHYNQAENTLFKIYNTDSELINTVSYGSELPQLFEWDSFNPNANYTEVNLDNYEYAILTLKDYSQTEAFETNLQLKGSIGITPVYEFGTIEKETVTDRCNVFYLDYTNYRLYVLKNDLINNAVYYVKSCKQGSAFKFDNTIFNITYVTTENVDDPVVTFGGSEYHTIPFNKLSNSANANEENNFIAGESGSSLSGIVDNVSNFTSDIWNAISSFMGLVTKFFNTLPEEFRYLSITSFTVLTVIAIIKFIRG